MRRAPDDLEQPVQEGGGAAHLLLDIEAFEIEHDGDPRCMPRTLAGGLQAALGMLLGIDHQMAVAVAQRDEVAFGIDDGLLHPGRALLQQPPQQMRFAGA